MTLPHVCAPGRGLLPGAAFAALLFAGGIAAAGREEVPEGLTRHVTDESGTLSGGFVRSLEQELSAYAESTSTQIAVLLLPSLGDLPIEEISLRVAERTGLGRKGRENGLLLVAALAQRKIRIEVGYGLEDVIPDALAGMIIRRIIAPRFRTGDIEGGIEAGVHSLMDAARGRYAAGPRDGEGGGSLIPLLLAFLILFLILKGLRRRGLGIGPGVFIPPIPGGWGGGHTTWGRATGGGFRGGGGSFGGGGASGGW
ncbi:MAG: TPM domain-containing protein [Bacteroidota bacterium]